MIRIGIVEDDSLDQASLEKMASEFFCKHLIESEISIFSSDEEFLSSDKSFDLLFFDIMLGGEKTGMDLAKKVRQLGNDEVTIVFVTSLMNYATEGYSVDATAYILKPLSEDEFNMKMEWVLKKLKSKKSSKIVLNVEGTLINVDVNDIAYIEVFGHYLTYHVGNKEYKVRQTLSSAESSLSDFGFFQISKYCLVNINKIDRNDGDSIYIGETSLSISRSKKAAFKKKIMSSINQ